ncbi:MAG TPA: hypothetical protein VMG08_18705 [Allosphingosinicella sp.]|nr:hypothetical protein [Allosphingosinicella sp.]
MRRWTYALGALLALQPATAGACSFSWRRGNSPDEIRANPNMRPVRGTFHFIQPRGENSPIAANAEGWLYGRIDGARGRYWNTIQSPMYEIAVECGAYTAPTGNGTTGIFWISRARRDRRYRVMLWEPAPVREDPRP